MKRVLSRALPALLLLAAALAATAFPDVFLLEREALARGEVWRLWTGHFVHHTWAHFAFDVGVALILVTWLRSALAWLVLPPAVGGAVLVLRPELTHYAGLSGVLHGLTVLLCVDLVARGRGAERWLAGAVLAGVVLKAIYETAVGGSVFTAEFDMGAAPLHVAHWVGVLAGGAWAVLVRHMAAPRSRRPADAPDACRCDVNRTRVRGHSSPNAAVLPGAHVGRRPDADGSRGPADGGRPRIRRRTRTR